MVATYRLQLQPGFGFPEVQALVPYFKRLGVSHLYLSPFTESRQGSTHGYDVIDHNKIREDLGGREGFNALLEAVREAGLALILDFVPNHAGVGPRNIYWQDVLAYGQYSPKAKFFDIEWETFKPELEGKILLPFLGTTYGEALDQGEIGLTFERGRFRATYHQSRFELSPATYADLLAHLLPQFERQEIYWDIKDLHDAFKTVEPSEREKAEALLPRLASVMEQIDLEATLFHSFTGQALHELLEKQFWRLAYWKTAGHEINYRRFFNINDLVALRMEDPVVFWDAHRLLGELLAQDGIEGVRIDHVDGLSDPHQYLHRLKKLGAPRIWVEKILAHGEILPPDWPVDGTTGYEFMNDVMGLLICPDGEIPLTQAYQRFFPDALPYAEELYESKRLVMATSLSSELFRLAYELDRLSESDYHTRDFTFEGLREALREVVSAFDRYRTYLLHDPEEARSVVQKAIYEARRRNPATETTVYDFISQVLLGELRTDLGELQTAWTRRFQQYTAPVAAKGVEDTAFYRYLRLAALNEVGGEPDRFNLPNQAFHSRARFRVHRYPNNLLSTATHDHKRGEDTRMRMILLGEMPDRWQDALRQFDEIAGAHRSDQGPTRDAEYLFYQILVALWGSDTPENLVERLTAYMMKAVNEAKRHTSWDNPHPAYEEALQRFIAGFLGDPALPEAIGPLAEALTRFGFVNTISQLILKTTTPGVPDFYQGCEFLDLSLVDPDNRREVDYALRRRLLESFPSEPDDAAVRTLIDADHSEGKLYLTAQLLRLRKTHPALFEGDYLPLEAEGDRANHLLAYARRSEKDLLLVLINRYPASLERLGGWGDTRLSLPKAFAGRTWTDVLSGATVEKPETLTPADLPLPWAVLQARI